MNLPVKLVGQATGPMEFIKELGMVVPTFEEMPKRGHKVLKHHVPLEFRGDFRPYELANYDPSNEYRTDVTGRVLCYATTKSGDKCSNRAVNRYPRCAMHGGQLHPFDRIEKATSEEEEPLTRYKQFQAGIITVDDLDDEELGQCGFRAKNGVIYRPRNVPRELTEAFTRAIYERASKELRALTVDAVHTVGEIMKNKTNEPDIRLKAALSLIERNLGKTPTQVNITAELKPFEKVFDSIQHVRSEREPRDGLAAESNIIDAELDGGEQRESNSPNAKADNTIGSPIESDSMQSDYDVPGSSYSTNVGYSEQSISQPQGTESPRDALKTKNPAILAQSIEVKPFEYDLSNNRQAIDKASRKRFAAKALGHIDPEKMNLPMVRQITKTDRGTLMIKFTMPVMPKIPKKLAKANAARKVFTLNDFH